MFTAMISQCTYNDITMHQNYDHIYLYIYIYICVYIELDGEQHLVFYYIDILDEIKRLLASPSLRGKQYVGFEPQYSSSDPSERVFDKSNGGLWMQELHMRFPHGRPWGVILNSDGSFFGSSKDGHPIYSKYCNLIVTAL